MERTRLEQPGLVARTSRSNGYLSVVGRNSTCEAAAGKREPSRCDAGPPSSVIRAVIFHERVYQGSVEKRGSGTLFLDSSDFNKLSKQCSFRSNDIIT